MNKMENERYPKHVAIILDGNRRWAKEHRMTSLQGHQAGFNNIKRLSTYILEHGVEVLTVFAFSTENFNRSEKEVNYLMDLFVKKFQEEKEFYKEKNIKVLFSGREKPLRQDVLQTIKTLEEETKNNTGGIFHVCLNYGSQYEIIDAVKKIVKEQIDVETLTPQNFYHFLYQDLPPVDLLIRTSGEQRLSNFLLYQASYAELYFTDTYFPDFDEQAYEEAIDEYLKRNRRFGGN